MRRMLLLAASVVVFFMLVACEGDRDNNALEPQQSPDAIAGLYFTETMVLQEGSKEPVLCAGVIQDSLPPQCPSGKPLMGWDWDAVTGEERIRNVSWANGPVLWGDYGIIGNWDGTRFEVVEVEPDPETYRLEPLPSDPPPEFDLTGPELGRIQREGAVWLDKHFDADGLTSSGMQGYVEFSVMVATDDMREALADRYGAGIVHLVPFLRRVET